MTIRALVVDDEPLSRERIRMLLARHPEVQVIGDCADGGEAVAAIRAQSPDLVFLDIQMPELDGFEVLERLEGTRMPAVIRAGGCGRCSSTSDQYTKPLISIELMPASRPKASYSNRWVVKPVAQST